MIDIGTYNAAIQHAFEACDYDNSKYLSWAKQSTGPSGNVISKNELMAFMDKFFRESKIPKPKWTDREWYEKCCSALNRTSIMRQDGDADIEECKDMMKVILKEVKWTVTETPTIIERVVHAPRSSEATVGKVDTIKHELGPIHHTNFYAAGGIVACLLLVWFLWPTPKKETAAECQERLINTSYSIANCLALDVGGGEVPEACAQLKNDQSLSDLKKAACDNIDSVPHYVDHIYKPCCIHDNTCQSVPAKKQHLHDSFKSMCDGSACSVNAGCEQLKDNCCPTKQGVRLGCCPQESESLWPSTEMSGLLSPRNASSRNVLPSTEMSATPASSTSSSNTNSTLRMAVAPLLLCGVMMVAALSAVFVRLHGRGHGEHASRVSGVDNPFYLLTA